jgi:putative serine protease PepD
MTSPRHLWAGNWREESEDARPKGRPAQDAPTVVAEPPEPTVVREPEPPAAPPEPPRRSRPPLRLLAAFFVPLVVFGAIAFAIVSNDDGGGGGGGSSAAVKTLPAQTTPAPTPKGANAQAIYASAGPAVASIRTGGGSGTGFLLTDNRTLVTNAHVVETADVVQVRFGPSGKDIRGRVMGSDPSSDLAVVKLLDTPPAAAKPLTLADSDRVAVGQTVIAIGNPFGLDRTVTQGIISALGREIQAPNGFAIENAIQTDAAINPGNSGGPLLDTAGRVVGVNSQIETGGSSGGNVGIGFAVPSNAVRRIVPQLAVGKTVEHAWLGVETSAMTSTGGGAAQVQRVVAGGPAASAGLRVGDVILAIDDKPVTGFSDIAKAVDEREPGEKLNLRVRRGGDESELAVTLGTRPQQVP